MKPVVLVSFAEAARHAGLSDRTVRRWANVGRLATYWWPSGEDLHGPRVDLEAVKALARSRAGASVDEPVAT